jgi:DNA ligase (NAD+)
VQAYFKVDTNLAILEKLKKAGVKLESEQTVQEVESDALNGKTFLYTGTFISYSREEIEAKIEANGGKLVSGVSKKLDFLIVGDGAGPSKLKKAEDLGIKMISESEFQNLLTI